MSEVLDLYEVTHIMQWNGQQAVNVYTYVMTEQVGTWVAPAIQLEQQWRVQFLNTDGEGFKCGAFSDELLSMIVRVKNLYNPLDYSEYLDGLPAGSNDNQVSSPYDAYSFRTPWLGPTIRRGFKRFPGVVEAYGVGGLISAPYQGYLAGMADALNTSFTAVNGGDSVGFAPCIVKRVKEVDEFGKVTYRLPTNNTEGVFDIVDEWQLVTRLTTQNSRKFGRGA